MLPTQRQRVKFTVSLLAGSRHRRGPFETFSAAGNGSAPARAGLVFRDGAGPPGRKTMKAPPL